MPAPGDQYHSPHIQNPFEEAVQRVSAFTAQEIATLQARLDKRLGPEFISTKPGPGGGQVAYLAAEKVIGLANEVFGFNGWSSSLHSLQIDFVEENRDTGRVNMALSVVCRVTLKDGTYHEDYGYGSVDNFKGKAAAFNKCKKEAATDGLKRALRMFGNVLGNCLYDKDYLTKIKKVPQPPKKFDADSLHRQTGFPPVVKQEPIKQEPVKQEAIKEEPPKLIMNAPNDTPQPSRTTTDHSEISPADFEDEFGTNLFDGVDISENPDDDWTVVTDTVGQSSSTTEAPPAKMTAPPNVGQVNRNNQGPSGQPRPQPPRVQSMQSSRPSNVTGQQHGAQQQQAYQPNSRPTMQNQNQMRGPQQSVSNQTRAPQTPNAHQNGPRGDPNRGRMAPPSADGQNRAQSHQHAQNQNQVQGIQPNRATPPHVGPGNQNNHTPQARSNFHQNTHNPGQPVMNKPAVGFVTSRAAGLVQNAEGAPGGLPPNVPAFNPHAESPLPKGLRTPGIDHTKSTKVTRQEVGIGSGPGQAKSNPATFNRPNFINPQQDVNRRIGMPTTGQSPMANRSAYKPPGMVTGAKRQPLTDVSNKGTEANGRENHDAKRMKMDGPGMENPHTANRV